MYRPSQNLWRESFHFYNHKWDNNAFLALPKVERPHKVDQTKQDTSLGSLFFFFNYDKPQSGRKVYSGIKWAWKEGEGECLKGRFVFFLLFPSINHFAATDACTFFTPRFSRCYYVCARMCVCVLVCVYLYITIFCFS